MTKLAIIHPEDPNSSAADALKHVMSLVEAGDISSVAVALVYRDGCSGQVHSKLPNTSLMLGAIARMQWDILRQAEAD